MTLREIHANHIKSYHIINYKQLCPLEQLMPCRANVHGANDHRATAQSGYCLIWLPSCQVTVIWATIVQDVWSGYYLVRLGCVC